MKVELKPYIFNSIYSYICYTLFLLLLFIEDSNTLVILNLYPLFLNL